MRKIALSLALLGQFSFVSRPLWASSLQEAVAFLADNKRPEAFAVLEEIFEKGTSQSKKEAAELLTSAYAGEIKEDPGFYADYVLKSQRSAEQGLSREEELRYMRLSADYFLKKNALQEAEIRYSELFDKGNRDEKDYAEYKKAWVLINQKKPQEAMLKLIALMRDSPLSKLKLSSAFDLGRFWGETHREVSLETEIEKVLETAEIRQEFFKGVQKTLLLPKSKSLRTQLRRKATLFKDSYVLMEVDMAMQAPSRDLACEKLQWADSPEQLVKVKGDAAYRMLSQCTTKNLSKSQKSQILAFVSRLGESEGSDLSAKASFYGNSGAPAQACNIYGKYFQSLTPTETALCETALEQCFLGFKDKGQAEDSLLVYRKTLDCSKKELSSYSLRLLEKLNHYNTAAVSVLLRDKALFQYFSTSLVPDLVYELALKKRDLSWAQEIAQSYFLEKSAFPEERAKSLEDAISRKLLQQGPEQESKLAQLLPKRDLASSEGQQLDLKSQWAQLKDASLDCKKNSDLILKTWGELENNGVTALENQQQAAFLVNAFSSYTQKSYAKSLATVLAKCPQSFALSKNLKYFVELRKASNEKITSLSTLTEKIQFTQSKIKTLGPRNFIHDKTYETAKLELLALIQKLEASLPAIQKSEALENNLVTKLSDLFKGWKGSLE